MAGPAADEEGQAEAGARNEEKAWLALALGWVAGFVDGVGYITLYHLFTAHMSGNSVGLGVDIGQGHWLDALHRVTPIIVYVVGVGVGAALIEAGYRRGIRATASAVLAVEAVALLLVITIGSGHLTGQQVDTRTGGIFYLLAALLAGAMGLQSATLRRVSGRTVRTNFVTGILTNLAEDLVVVALTRRRKRTAETGAAMRRAGLLSGIWVTYLVGAIVGAVLDFQWRLEALALPLTVLAVVIVVDLARPFQPSLPAAGQE